MNEILHQLFLADQADRQEPIDWGNWSQVDERDSLRHQQVQEMIKSGLLIQPEDFYHASVVFQHGKVSADYKIANELAKISMNMGYEPAKIFYAKTLDRYLLSINKPQKFGTQRCFIKMETKYISLSIPPPPMKKDKIIMCL